jgi:hypothetical protein
VLRWNRKKLRQNKPKPASLGVQTPKIKLMGFYISGGNGRQVRSYSPMGSQQRCKAPAYTATRTAQLAMQLPPKSTKQKCVTPYQIGAVGKIGF